uniref:Major facilitator superfamily (MFS) profile domain-containing protein n=1 Tax=Noctiluca scintillans TaxID=2966 RepID=A0A7S1F216_NOCSC
MSFLCISIIVLWGLAGLLILLFPVTNVAHLHDRRLIWAAANLRTFAHYVFISVMIPTAYTVAADSPNRAAVSGALIGATAVLVPFGAAVGRYLSEDLSTIKLGVSTFGTLLFANAAANAVCFDLLRSESLLHAAFVTRFAHGFFAGALGVLIESHVLAVTPPTETTAFFQLTGVAATLGIAVGPLAAVGSGHELGRLSAWPEYFAANAVALAVVVCFVAVPRDLAEEDYELMIGKQVAPEVQTDELSLTVSSSANLPESSRKWVWVLGLIAFINNKSIVAACQTGTSLILEVGHGWPPADIGLGLAMASLCAVPLLFALLQLSDVRNLVLLGGAMLLSGLLLVVANLRFSRQLPCFLLIVDVLIYCFVSSGTSLSTSAASNASLEGTLFNQPNLVFFTHADGFFTFATATSCRYFVGSWGLWGYVGILSVLTVLQFLLYSGQALSWRSAASCRRGDTPALEIPAESSQWNRQVSSASSPWNRQVSTASSHWKREVTTASAHWNRQLTTASSHWCRQFT